MSDTQINVGMNVDGVVAGTNKAKSELRTLQAEVDKVARASKEGGAALGKVGEGVDAEKAAKQLSRIAQQVKRVSDEAVLGRNSVELFAEKLAKTGVNAEVYRPLLDAYSQVRKSTEQTNAEFTKSGRILDQYGNTAKGTAAALRQVPAQFTDIIVSLQGGQAPMTVLLQQGGQLKDVFGGVGNAAKAMGGYVLGLVNPFTVAAAAIGAISYAAYKASEDAKVLNKALALEGFSAGTTIGELSNIADAIKATGTSSGTATAALVEFVGAGVQASESLGAFVKTAIELERVGGPAVKETAKAFAELSKDPLKGLDDLTLATYKQIEALLEQGDKVGAARVAQEAFNEANKNAVVQIEAQFGPLDQAAKYWKEVGVQALYAAGGIAQALGFGSLTGNEQRAKLQKERDTRFTNGYDTAELDKQLDYFKRLDGAQKQSTANVTREMAVKKALADVERSDPSLKRLRERSELVAQYTLLVDAGQRSQEQFNAALKAFDAKGAKKVKAPEMAGFDQEQGKAYAKYIEESNKALLDAQVKTDGLTKSQGALVAMLTDPVFQAMPETWKQTALQAKYAAIAQEQSNAATDAAEAANSKYVASLNESAASIEKKLTALGDETKAYGLSIEKNISLAEAIDSVAIARLEEQKAIELSYGDEKAVEAIEREIKARKELAKELNKKANHTAEVEAGKAAAAATLAEWKKGWEETDRLARDVFTTWATDGSSAAQKIGDTLKKALLSAIYEATLKPIAFQLYTSIAGGGGSGGIAGIASQTANSLNGVGSALKSIGGYADAFNGSGLSGLAKSSIGQSLGLSTAGVYRPALDTVGAPTLTSAGDLFSAMPIGGMMVAYSKGGIGGFASGVASTAAAGAISGGLAASAAGTGVAAGAMGGASAALAAVPGWGWAAMAALAVLGNKGDAETKYGGNFASDAAGNISQTLGNGTGGNMANQAMEKGIALTTTTINSLLKSIGSAATVAAFAAGGQSDQEKPEGYSFAGGSLSTGQSFGQGYHGDNLGLASPEQVMKAYGEDLQRATLEAIKSAADIPKSIGDMLKDVDIKTLSGTALSDLGTQVVDTIQAVDALRGAVGNLSFDDAAAKVQMVSQVAGDLRLSGETSGAALARVAAEITTVNGTLGMLGGKLLSVDAAGIKAADGLVQAMGGLEAFQQQTASYYNQYYSQEEQRMQTALSIQARLAQGGIDVSIEQVLNGTREQFRALVDSFKDGGGLMDEAGQKAVAALMAVAGAFAGITTASANVSASSAAAATESSFGAGVGTSGPSQSGWSGPGGPDGASEAANAILQERKTLQDELDNLTMTSTELLEKQRNALDESNRALFDQIQVAKEAARVAEQNKSLQDEYNQLTMTSAQLRALEREEIAEANLELFDRITALKAEQEAITTANNAVDAALAGVQRAIDAEKKSIEAARQAAQERVGILKSIVDSIGSAVDNLRGNVDSTKAQAARQANAFIDNALATAQASGYMPDADDLKDAISKATAGINREGLSQFEYEKQQLILAGKLEALGAIAEPQLSAAEEAVKVAEDQLKALDAMMQEARNQVDELRGIDTSVKSVEAAIAALASAILGVQAATSGGAVTINPGDYQANGTSTGALEYIGESTGGLSHSFWNTWAQHMQAVYGEDAGYKVYNMAIERGVTAAQLEEILGMSAGQANAWALSHGLAAFDVGTNMVPHDMVAQIHEGEAIIPKAYNPAAGGVSGNARLESLVEGLTKEVQRLQAIVNDGNKSNERIATAVNGQPDRPMLVETVV